MFPHFIGFLPETAGNKLSRDFSTGEVPEWSNGHDWKSCVPFGYRGFESHPLRKNIIPIYLGNREVPVGKPAAKTGALPTASYFPFRLGSVGSHIVTTPWEFYPISHNISLESENLKT